jgi:hypothetical protein
MAHTIKPLDKHPNFHKQFDGTQFYPYTYTNVKKTLKIEPTRKLKKVKST